MGLVLNFEFKRINTKSSKFFECINYHTQIVVSNLLKMLFITRLL